MNNNLDTRIQHAVIGETNNAGKTTATDDVPLKGEIIFNDTLNNFRVGDGSLQYSALSDFLPSIPAAQVNSDWNASSGVAQILNKPTTETWTFTTAAGVTVTKHVLIQ